MNKIDEVFMIIKKDNKKHYIARDDLMKLLMNHIGDYDVTDLGKWLKTKTDNNFTVVELEFINQTFSTIEDIAKSVNLFKKEWLAKMDITENHLIL